MTTEYSELPAQSGGDKILVDSTTDDDGIVTKAQVALLGVAEAAPGLVPQTVSRTNPCPVYDAMVITLLREILEVLREICMQLRKR